MRWLFSCPAAVFGSVTEEGNEVGAADETEVLGSAEKMSRRLKTLPELCFQEH